MARALSQRKSEAVCAPPRCCASVLPKEDNSLESMPRGLNVGPYGLGFFGMALGLPAAGALAFAFDGALLAFHLPIPLK